MKRESSQGGGSLLRSALYAAVMVGLTFGVAEAQVSGRVVGGTNSEVEPVNQISGTGECTVDADCDDGNACTEDICNNATCEHTEIPGCVPCEVGLDCPPIDVVFVVDTSGSMKDEAAALCESIDQIVTDLAAQGVTVSATILGITVTPEFGFTCLSDNVVSLLGGEVPGLAPACDFPDSVSSFESWGPATAIVADRFPWVPDSARMIVPISDEGPCRGNRPDGCNDPGDDRGSISNAIDVARRNGVFVSPVTGSGADNCVRTLAEDLAAGTFGTVLHTSDLPNGLPAAILDLLAGLCEVDDGCDDGDFCTCDDTCIDGVCTGTPVPDCKPCNATGFCSDGNACTDDACVDFECITTPNYDTEAFICDPFTGELTPRDEVEDDNPCTRLEIDPCTGEAFNVPVRDGTVCDDGLFCTEGDVCIEGACIPGVERDCREADGQCAIGVCDEDQDACVGSPVNENQPCDDGDPCTLDDACEQAACVGEPVTCPDNGDPCTDLVCDPEGPEGNCDGLINVPGPCDDGDACTINDTCVDGECLGIDERVCEDDNVCTDDSCDPATGCVFTPVPDRACDDGDVCTIGDACDESGTCLGTDLNTIPCETDADCFGTACDTRAGFCVCGDVPQLCLEVEGGEPVPGCFNVGDKITVLVRLGFSAHVVTGGQFLIDYDPALLDFVSVAPGSTADPASPFSMELAEEIDEVAGTVFYSVGTNPNDPEGTTGPAIMAALSFTAREACTSTALCFLSENPQNTLLVGEDGQEVPFTPCCTEPINIQGDPVDLACPESVTTNADAGQITALVEWEPASVTGGCGESVAVECTGTHNGGANVDGLAESGGVMPTGLSEFECRVHDICGEVASCTWSVMVNRANTVEVTIQLSPTIEDRSLFRCVEFELFDACASPKIVEETVEFGGSFNLPGHAKTVMMKVPAGQYACITARDPLHTLRSVADMTIEGTKYVVIFKGDPVFGGNWLRGGNLNGDHVVDVLDFGIFNQQSQRPIAANTPCGTPRPHADINGDGLVDTIDLTFIVNNFLEADKASCCDFGGTSAVDRGPITEISVRELIHLGMGDLAGADVNGDGLLNTEDMSAYLQGQRPAEPKGPASRLRSRQK